MLHDKLESEYEAGAACFTFATHGYDIASKNLDIHVNNQVHVSNEAHVSNAVSEYAKSFENVHMTEDEPAFAYDFNPVGPLDLKLTALQQVPEARSGYLVNSVKEKTLEERDGNFGACFTFPLPSSTHEVLMVLKDTQLCAHRGYYGGNEREYHRGAHGHTRHIVCKDIECSKTEIFAERKDPGQLWRYLVQIALCTLWGRSARS